MSRSSAGDLQSRRSASQGSRSRHPVPSPPRGQGVEGRAGGRGPAALAASTRSTWSYWLVTCRSSRRASWSRSAGRSSTSIIPSCRPSSGRILIDRPTTEVSRSSGRPPHYVTAELDAGPIIHQDVAPRLPQGRRGRYGPDRPGGRAPRSRPGRALAPGRPRPGRQGIRTVVFE